MKIKVLCIMLSLCGTLLGSQKPNIIFLLADDLTRWDIGCYGSPDSKTPAIDALAAEGMQFSKCYQSAPMCSPTRHNIYTGIYPTRTGAYPNHTFAKEGTRSIVHYLRPLGYRVAQSGKRHIGPEEVFPFEYLGNVMNPDFGKVDSFLMDVRASGEPFCLFLCSNEPHGPWNKGDASQFDPSSVTLPPHYYDNSETRENYCRYLAEINYLDGQVAEALGLLEKHGLSENTVFIFASEQGNSFPFAKWTCYNAGLGSALIVRWPGVVAPGSKSGALVEYSDITPTMIDIAGGDPVGGLDGESLVPLLKGERSTHKDFTHGLMTTRGIIKGSEYYPIRTVSNGTYRYVVNLAPEEEFYNVANMPGWEEAAETDAFAASLVQKHRFRPPVELFNDEKDPYNLENLAGQKPYRKIEKKLGKQLEKWMEYAGDEGLITELRAFEHMRFQNGDSLVLIAVFQPPRGTGNLTVPRRGYYSFYISGKGSIHVDDRFIVEGKPAGETETITRYGIIALEPGAHKVYLEGPGTQTQIQWSGPGLKREALRLD